MIDVRRIRTEPDAVARRRSPAAAIDTADARPGRSSSTSGPAQLAAERDDLRARVNAISKEVGALRRDGDVAERRGHAGREP